MVIFFWKHDKYHFLRNALKVILHRNYQARYERYLLTTFFKYFGSYSFFYSIYHFGKKRTIR